MSFFNRPNLAKKFADRIVSEKGASGTFIAALRRTGKSTFIREDLIPILERSGAVVIYVDLWANKLADPGVLIAGAVRDHLRAQDGVVAQLARKAGLEKITIGGLQLNLDKVGTDSGETLSKALVALSQETKSLIVMVIDEAQHAQTTDAGSASLYALKAARDELNSSKHHGFRLVATGSNIDKLAILVQGKEQAFLNARLVELPHLSDDYLEWKVQSFVGNAKPSLSALKVAFELCTHRPEVLGHVLDDMELFEGIDSDNVDLTLKDMVLNSTLQGKNSFFNAFNSLEPLQAALLKIMAEQRSQFAPYTEKTVALSRAFCAERTNEDVKIDSSSVGYALDSLRKNSFIWRSGRGVYSIEDTQHIAWLTGTPEVSLDKPHVNHSLGIVRDGSSKATDEPASDMLGVVKSGFYSGKILDVDDDLVIQKTGRGGETVRHSLALLSFPVVVGSVVEIAYKDGVGAVSGPGVDLGVGR